MTSFFLRRTFMRSSKEVVKYTVKNMSKSDVPQVLDIWRETKMHQGTHSLYTWLEVDPEGFKVAVTDEGLVIGFCTAIIHHKDLAFGGLYSVKEKYRGAGIGLKVWKACADHIGNRNVGMYAASDKAELYRSRGGIPIVESSWVCYVNQKYSPVNADNLSNTPPKGVSIEPFKESRISQMYDYDRRLIGYDRHLAIKLLCKEQDSKTYLAVKNGECVGFGAIKMSCQNIPLVAPLYADDKEIAEVLLNKLILSFPEEKGLAIWSLSNNDAANELVQRIGFNANHQERRILCSRKPVVLGDPKNVYGILNLSFSPY